MENNMLNNEDQFLNFDMELDQKQCFSFFIFYNLHLTFIADQFELEIQRKLRLGFIQKVYGILLVQLAFTTLLCLISMISPNYAAFQQNQIWLFWLAFAISLITVIILSCIKSAARQVPLNYILLFVFTLTEGYIVSFICSFYSASIVLMAASLTTAMVLSLTVYACTTKTDFTMMGGMLFVFLCLLICFGFITIFIHTEIVHLIYCICGVFLFSIYLIFDTQLILGKFQQMYSLDDYILAALELYLDIINIFIYILQILGSKD